MATTEASQITAYSFKPFIELSQDEYNRLSPMTRNAKNVIYVTGFLANTKMNKNGFRITDNKYIEQNKGLAAGRPINFGPKVLGKAHHPNFYQDLDVDEERDPQGAKKAFLEYQEWSRIGDILKISYDKPRDRWQFYGAISHPNIVDAIEKGSLQLPKYVSPYFWNLNHPKDTGPEIREAELFHVSFVDDPAYGPEAVASPVCSSSEGTTCQAKLYGMGAGVDERIQARKGKPPCMCGLMASIDHKVSSSLYIENPKSHSKKSMSDPNSNPPQPNPQENNPNQGGEDENSKQSEALKRMQNYGKDANDAKTDLNKKEEQPSEKKKQIEIPIEFQDIVNIQIEKERSAMTKQHNKALAEKDEVISSLQKEIASIREKEREGLISRYIQKDTFKEEGKFEERVNFYKNLKLSNDELEAILKDHWEIKEVQVSLDHSGGSGKKGKGAGTENKALNLDPFGFESGDQIGLLTPTIRKGLGASVNPDNNDEDSGIPSDNDEDILTEERGRSIIGAFS